MLTTILIDGEEKQVDFQDNHTLNVWGHDLTGRHCVVARHRFKREWMEHLEKGGSIRSCGCRYSMEKK